MLGRFPGLSAAQFNRQWISNETGQTPLLAEPPRQLLFCREARLSRPSRRDTGGDTAGPAPPRGSGRGVGTRPGHSRGPRLNLPALSRRNSSRGRAGPRLPRPGDAEVPPIPTSGKGD